EQKGEEHQAQLSLKDELAARPAVSHSPAPGAEEKGRKHLTGPHQPRPKGPVRRPNPHPHKARRLNQQPARGPHLSKEKKGEVGMPQGAKGAEPASLVGKRASNVSARQRFPGRHGRQSSVCQDAVKTSCLWGASALSSDASVRACRFALTSPCPALAKIARTP